MSAELATASPTWRVLLRGAADSLGDRTAARWLVEEAAQTDAAGLLARLDEHADPAAAERLGTALARRHAGEPLQHILGHWPFAGTELRVDRRALVPRHETEVLVEAAHTELGLAAGSAHVVVDLGTGSGAIACALVASRRDVTVFGVERADAALSLAGENRAALAGSARERLFLLAGSWYEPLPAQVRGAVTLVVANPPYLAAEEWAGLDAVVRDHDPYDALVAGPTGLEAIEAVIAGAPAVLARPGALLCEIAPHQHAEVSARARAAGAREVAVLADLAGRPRVVRARW